MCAHSAQPTALIVDDVKFNRTLLRSTLTRLGYAVAEAADAPEAFARLREEAIAVVFLDWELPGAKGDAVMRHIRENHGALPVIAITADTSAARQARCRQAGADGFLGKAFDPGSVQTILAAVGRSGGASALPGQPPKVPEPSTTAGPAASSAPSATASSATASAPAVDLARVAAEAVSVRTTLAAHASRFPGGLTEALRNCREQFDAEWQVLAEAFAAGENDRAAFAAHKLSSLAAVIGATQVHRAARDGEDALRDPEAQPRRPALVAHLGATVAAMQSALAGERAAEAGP